MAIANEKQLLLAFEQVNRLHQAIASLRRDTGGNVRNFALLAEGPLAQIEALQQQIDEYTGLATIRDLDAEVWLSVTGKTIEYRRASTSVLTEMLDVLRKGVQAVTEVIATGSLGTRPTSDLKRACDLQLVALVPGSLRVGLRLPSDDLLLFDDATRLASLASAGLDKYLSVAEWAGSKENESVLDQMGLDAPIRRTVLAQLARLVPRERGDVSTVELSGRRVRSTEPIRFVRATRRKLNAAIDSTVEERPEVFQGFVREIDLDKRSFILRHPENPTEYRCEFDESLLETAKKALDCSVEVAGTRAVAEHRRSTAPLKVTRLEVLGDEDTSPGGPGDPSDSA